jgi:hypothetical protein
LTKLGRALKPQRTCESSFFIFDLKYHFSSADFASVPHYHVVSKNVDVGVMSPVVNYLRAFLIEGVYRRMGRFSILSLGILSVADDDILFTATMFPETANWLTPADEYVFPPFFLSL